MKPYVLKSGLLASFALAGILSFAAAVNSPANAEVVTWNLLSNGVGNLGNTPTFTATGSPTPTSYSIQVTGFQGATFTGSPPAPPTSAPNFWTMTGVSAKSAGATETGLGLTNDPQHEIATPGLLQVDTQGSLGLNFFQFSMGSVTQNEAWTVYGSNGTGNGAVLTALWSGGPSSQSALFNLSGYRYYDFFSTGTSAPGSGDNVILASFAGSNTQFYDRKRSGTVHLGDDPARLRWRWLHGISSEDRACASPRVGSFAWSDLKAAVRRLFLCVDGFLSPWHRRPSGAHVPIRIAAAEGGLSFKSPLPGPVCPQKDRSRWFVSRAVRRGPDGRAPTSQPRCPLQEQPFPGLPWPLLRAVLFQSLGDLSGARPLPRWSAKSNMSVPRQMVTEIQEEKRRSAIILFHFGTVLI